MIQKSLQSPYFISYIRSHLQALQAGFLQLKKSLASTLITCVVIGIALALPIGMLVLLKNVRIATHTLKSTHSISIYLKTDIPESKRQDLLNLLRQDQSFDRVEYISPEDGLKDFQKQLAIDQDILQDIQKNPLPGVIAVQPVSSIQNPDQISQMSDRLKKLPGVDQVQLDMAWLQRLNAILALIHRFIVAVMLLFSFGVLLIVSHTIQLITENHRDEIAILKLLGASNGFIRRPFLYSGILYGLLGSMVAFFLITLIVWELKEPIEQLASLYHSHFKLQGPNEHLSLVLLALGGLLGYFGSWLATNRHINSIS